MKIFLIIASLLTVAVAQQPSISCYYYLNDATYACYLTIDNPNGFNDFTEIEGIHLEGFNNSDVKFISAFGGDSTNIPSIICNLFPNTVSIYFDSVGITEIDDSSFAGCLRITELGLIYNRISSISTNALINLPELTFISLEFNLLTALPENVFANQNALTELHLGQNPIQDIPAGVFRYLENLERLHIINTNINTINSQWFATNVRLSELYLSNNRITLTADSFVGLNDLHTLDLGYNLINEIPDGVFADLQNLEFLYLYGNNIPDLQADAFPYLGHLSFLDISENPFEVIYDGAFRRLPNLITLNIAYGSVHELHSNSLENLGNLVNLNLNINHIEELPQGVFEPSPNLEYIGLWSNRLKTLRRNRFGPLESLQVLDLDNNVLNGIDISIIDDAVNLNILYFSSNLCASGFFGNFIISREQFMPILERCFSNMRYLIEITTDADDDFIFFEGLQPGIACRVAADNEVQFALTSFEFIWSPVIEVLIGTANNTRSVIRMNQEIDVVTVPTPNIISRNQLNDFRVTWANHNILVFRNNDTFPFMGFAMQHIFPVNFYGVRSVDTSALWSVQPFDL